MSLQFVKASTSDALTLNGISKAFYSKLGYTEARRDNEFIYYSKFYEKNGFMLSNGTICMYYE